MWNTQFTEDEKTAFLERKGYTVKSKTFIENRGNIYRGINDKDYVVYQDDTVTDIFAYIGDEPISVEKKKETYLLRIVFARVFKECVINNL